MPGRSPATQLKARDLQRLLVATEIQLVSRETGEVVEELTMLRFAGHYRSSGVDTYAVRDASGKFRLRSEVELGLTEESPYVAYLASPQSYSDRKGA